MNNPLPPQQGAYPPAPNYYPANQPPPPRTTLRSGTSLHLSSLAHYFQECQLLKAAGEKCKIKNFTEKTTALDFITPLRLLMKGVKNSGTLHSTIFDENDENVIKFIKKIKKGVDEKDIKEAIAYSKKNSIPLEFGCQAVYEVLSNLQHNCSPNTYFNVLKSREILFRAAENIKKGESINFCKADLMKCNYFRRKQLYEMSIECSFSR